MLRKGSTALGRNVPPKLGRAVKRLAAAHPALPIVETARLLVDHYHGEGTWYSPAALAAELPKVKSSKVLAVLGLLSGEPYGVLTVKWTILGSEAKAPGDEDEQDLFEISASAAFAALHGESLEHPLTGEAIEAGRLRLHYQPNFPLANP